MKTLFEVIPYAIHTAASLAATPLTEIQSSMEEGTVKTPKLNVVFTGVL
jgi:hypothetical protein